MKLKYKCIYCGRIVSGIWCDTPNRGTYIRVKCVCGLRGWAQAPYEVYGFEKQEATWARKSQPK